MSLSHLPKLVQALPLDDAVRIEPREGVPVFRATPRIQGRIEDLLAKQTEGPLNTDEERELLAYEELDELLSLVNRLVRSSMSPDGWRAPCSNGLRSRGPPARSRGSITFHSWWAAR
jgi:hypothetical protein